MIGKKIPVVFRIMFVIWVILQVCLVIKYWDMPNHDDAQAYVKLASECIARGTWYPDVHNPVSYTHLTLPTRSDV